MLVCAAIDSGSRVVAREIARAAEPFGSRLATQLDGVFSQAMVGDMRFGDLLSAQTRIRIEGVGPASARQLIPETPSAAELLSGGPNGAAAQSLRGYIELVDPAGQRLRGIALANGPDGYVANQFLNFDELVKVEVPRLDGLDAAARASMDDMLVDFGDDIRSRFAPNGPPAARVDDLGWITLADETARPFEQHLRHIAELPGGKAPSARTADEIAHLLTHEGRHLRDDVGSAELSWLEEARTELGGRLTSNVQRTAEVLRLPHALPVNELTVTRHLGLGAHPYTELTDALAATLQRAGFNVDDPRGAAEAVSFVDSAPLGELVDRIAGRIVEHQQLLPSFRPKFAGAIEIAAGDPVLERALVGNVGR